MPWNINNYPSSLTNLHEAVRKKAIYIANGKEVAKSKGTGITIHRKDGIIEDHISYN